PSTSSSGGKTYNGKLMKHCNKWLRWAFVEAAWVAMGCDSYFGDLYKKKRALGKKANTAILCVARRMARITWQLLTQGRDYQKMPPAPQPKANAAKAKTKQTLTPLRYALRAARSSLSVSLRSAPQPLQSHTGWLLSLMLTQRTTGQDGGLGI
ncbi:MAG: transposase, partial [Prosthecobacter sp.]|nr:transposase [Prosthecobacter sp.]